MNARKTRLVSVWIALLGVLLMSSGFALFAGVGTAKAQETTEKPWICHAVEGKGETKTGYNLINPADASSHIDEAQYPGGTYWKHASNDGTRHDMYATYTGGQWTCPGPEIPDVEAYADVQWIDPTCDTPADFALKSGDPVDVTWSEPSAEPAPGVQVTLTATALPGYTFGGQPTKSFTHTYLQVIPPEGQVYDPETGTCQAVEPPAGTATAGVTAVQPTCADVNGSWTATAEHATADEGALTGDGVRNGSVTVSFTADEGYEFAGGSTTKSVTVDFGDVVAPEGFVFDEESETCVAVEPPVVPPEEPPVEPPTENPKNQVLPPEAAQPEAQAPVDEAGISAEVPSAVHAGLAGTESTAKGDALALVLTGALLVLVGGAGTVRKLAGDVQH